MLTWLPVLKLEILQQSSSSDNVSGITREVVVDAQHIPPISGTLSVDM
jgi:hypothetical protein